MSQSSPIAQCRLVAFAPSTDLARSCSFYGQLLGLHVAEQTPFALVIDTPGTQLRVTLVHELKPQPFTVLGWQVESLEESVRVLRDRGVQFLRYPGMNDNHPLAIWTAPSGAQIAWFNDPDGNVLSLTQF